MNGTPVPAVGPTPLPSPRGPLSDAVLATLARGAPAPLDVGAVGGLDGGLHDGGLHDDVDPLGDDAQVALFVLQELSYRPVAGVDPAWETEPSAVVLRLRLEAALERHLRAAVMADVPAVTGPEAVPAALVHLLAEAGGPSLSAWVAEHGTLEHLREFAVHRSAYQLKEADPHSAAIPRIAAGATKSALLDIQVDEYGPEPGESHAALFAATMTALGLDPAAGPDVDRLPATTLATNTLLTTLASSRRTLGALVGHLAVFEMSSVEPMARYAAAVRRVLPGRAGTRAARFYDVHVAADGRHEVIALERLVASFVAEHPALAGDVLFGAAALLAVERAMAEHLLACWTAGTTSLRRPLPDGTLRPPGPQLRLAG